MAAISLRGVSKSFGGKKAADQITFDVADREFLVLLGPSGCGKSTLLRMLACLQQVVRGEIHVGARRVDTLRPSARDMAFVFQSYALYPHMTVRRNITFPLIIRAHRWWFHLPLIGGRAKPGIGQTPAGRAPGGRGGRGGGWVGWGRGGGRGRGVCLWGEPLSNLDAKLRSSMRAEIIKLHREV